MAKPQITIPGIATAWGDFAETTEPLLQNLFAVSIKLPAGLKAFNGGQHTVSLLASGVELPEEAITVEEIPTKLSSYDVVVGKERGQLSLTFKEQVGAPVSRFFSAWHKIIVDARGAGIGFPADYATEVWVAALAGNGVPFYWWGFKRAFPKARGNNVNFANDSKTGAEINIPFSYLEMMDEVDALTGEGANMFKKLKLAATGPTAPGV